jgi:sigma-E factor negative regulatory protein RseA
VNQDQVESQLSAMFDGELPVAECELLSRRIDRDENLRARWSRYALIGAAMRSEPVAAARSGFATRVSAALSAEVRPRGTRPRHLLWNAALAATLVAGVAGLSIAMLRDTTSRFEVPGLAVAGATRAAAALEHAPGVIALPALAALPTPVSASIPALPVRAADREPWSYVTPPVGAAGNSALRTQLADYMVAHSVYSTPLMQRNLMSALVGGEDGLGNASDYPSAAGAGAVTREGKIDAAATADTNAR